MRYISVGLMVRVEDDIAARHEELIAYLESHIFRDEGFVGHILTITDATEQVEARLDEIFKRRPEDQK